MKSWFYPHIDKSQVFELGYIASLHTGGFSIDITIIETGKTLHKIHPIPRTLLDKSEIYDGTVDMGSSFDLFSKCSHYENDLLEEEYKVKRKFFKNKMISHGFRPYSEEWWHFSFPFDSSIPATTLIFL